MNKPTKQAQGFTIIEVVLVLAIAALIMLMVFIAWPALQRSQRDNALKQDAQSVASALGTFKGNNNGRMPTATGTAAGSFAAFKTDYVKDTGRVDATNISANTTAATRPTTNDQMTVTIGYKCDATANARGAAIWVKLEAGGGSNFCVDA